MEIEEDPETGEEWLSINVTVAGIIEEVLASYEQYTRQLISRVPWPQPAQAWMRQVERMIQVLDGCLSEPKRSQLIQAIHEYEKKISS